MSFWYLQFPLPPRLIMDPVHYTLLEKLRQKFDQFKKHVCCLNLHKFYNFNKFFHFFRSPLEANRPLDRPLDKPKPPKPSAKVQKRTNNQNEFHEKTVEIDEIYETM